MTARQTFRIGGVALLAGAVLSFLTTLLNTFLFVGNDPTPYAGNPLFVPVNILSALGTGLLLVGVPLLYVSRPEGWGALGLVGFALLFTTGLMFGIFFSLFSALFVQLNWLQVIDAHSLNNNPINSRAVDVSRRSPGCTSRQSPGPAAVSPQRTSPAKGRTQRKRPCSASPVACTKVKRRSSTKVRGSDPARCWRPSGNGAAVATAMPSSR